MRDDKSTVTGCIKKALDLGVSSGQQQYGGDSAQLARRRAGERREGRVRSR